MVDHAKLQIGCYFIYGLAMVIVFLRLYARKFLVGFLGADDFFIIAGAVTSTGIIVTIPFMYGFGIGRHYTDLTDHEIFYGRMVSVLGTSWQNEFQSGYSGHGFLKFSITSVLGDWSIDCLRRWCLHHHNYYCKTSHQRNRAKKPPLSLVLVTRRALTCLKVNMGLICASVPALRSLFKGTFRGSSEEPYNSHELNSHSRGTAKSKTNITSTGETQRTSRDISKSLFRPRNRRASLSNDSEENIIPPDGSVVRTTEFQIGYSARCPEDDDLENRATNGTQMVNSPMIQDV
ncbi:hypothetical protein M432DRAFT_589176 [Thermoascus aurantiacus ATCC 26904]